MEFLKANWPLLLIAGWFIYKWWSTKGIKKMLPELKRNGAVLIDVRSYGEYQSGHVPGTMNIPLDELNSRIKDIPKTSTIVLACASGTRSGMAKMLFRKNGYKTVYNIGAWTNFKE